MSTTPAQTRLKPIVRDGKVIGHGQQLAEVRLAKANLWPGTGDRSTRQTRRNADRIAATANAKRQRRADFMSARTALKARKEARRLASKAVA